jgi:hypothetical protein
MTRRAEVHNDAWPVVPAGAGTDNRRSVKAEDKAKSVLRAKSPSAQLFP